MSALSIQPTYPIFTETDGLPLENGYIWIGAANLDPQGNPINVYWDAALTVAAPQPIRTINGYPSRSGTPARLYVNSDYSIRVQDSKGSLAYSAPEALERYSGDLISFTGFKGQVGVIADLADDDGSDWIGFTSVGSGSVSRSAQDKMQDTVSVKDFGAVGDGVTDDTDAIQTAIDAANIIVFPSGTYRLTTSVYDSGTDWRHHIIVPSNKTLIFNNGGTIITTTPFASRAVAFLVRGSNVVVDGLRIEDDHTGNPFIVGVGSGSSYDSSYPDDMFEELRVFNSIFKNCWLSVSVQFSSTDGNAKFFNDIQVIGCNSYAKPNNTSSGNFNFRSDGPWRIKNVNIANCIAFDGYSASSFNFYGIDGFSVSGCTSYRNKFAGCEMENGSQDGVVSCFRSIDDFWGVWVDDSRRIVVDGVSHKTISESVTGLLGTESRLRNVLKVTHQGFTGYTTWETTGLVFSNVVSEFGRISTEAFGSSPSGSIGRLSFNNISISQDGVSRSSGNTAVAVLDVPLDVRFNNVKVFGAPDKSFNLGTTGGVVRLNGVLTGVVAAESSTGIKAIGTGELRLEDVDTHSQSIAVTTTTYIDYVVAGVVQADRRAGQRFYYAVTGSPESVLTAGPGSLAYRVDVGQLYVKGSGTGNTGWLLVTAT